MKISLALIEAVTINGSLNKRGIFAHIPFKYTIFGMTNLLQKNKISRRFDGLFYFFVDSFRFLFPKQSAGYFCPTVLGHILTAEFGFSCF